MGELTEGHEAVLAMLSGRGCRSWLTGLAALLRVQGREPPPCIELLTDADAGTCSEVLAIAGELADVGGLRLEPLGPRSLEEALAARGISSLAIGMPPDGGEPADPFGGLSHIASGQIRTVLPPDVAFREAPILLIRIAGLVAWTGHAPSPDVRKYASRDCGNVLDIPDRRAAWGDGVGWLLLGPHVADALQWMQETRLLSFLLPEVAAMVGFDRTCTVHHKDIWEHTRQVTEQAAPDPVVRWAALCHDIGKVWTRALTRTGKVHFFRHEGLGALLFESIAHRFGLDEELARRTAYLIENHSRANLYRDEWTDNAVRRLMRETGEHLDDLVRFSKADFTTRRESRKAEVRRLTAELEERIAAIRAEEAKLPLMNKGIGNAIMQCFGLRPSKAVGDLRRKLEAAIGRGRLPERGDDAVYIDWLASDPETAAIIREARDAPAAATAPKRVKES